MKISNDILVGVEYKKLCDFYSTLQEYANRLPLAIKIPENMVDTLTLIGLSVFSKGEYICEHYYVEFDNSITAFYMVTKNTKNVNENTEIITHSNVSKSTMIHDIKSQKFVLDLDYFIKNN